MRHSTRWLMFLIAAMLVFAGCAPATTATPAAPALPAAAPLPAEISVAEAAAKRDAGAFILDVRQPEEWNEVHIPGAKLIPLDQLEQRVNEVPRDKEVVVVCQSGGRSKQGCALLKQAGYTQVTSMIGGMTTWSAAGYLTVTGP